MRWKVIDLFNELIFPFVHEIKSIAVVGGGASEPELEIFRGNSNLVIHYYGIDSNVGSHDFTYLDLNNSYLQKSGLTKTKYDLILCSQVLEHIWDVKQGLSILVQLAADNGLIWVACPASNYAHGSPSYFSAGYQPELIENLLEKERVEIIAKGCFGSKRYYFMTHALQIWATRNEHMSPLTFGFSRYFPRQILGRFIAMFRSAKIATEPRYATETYVLARKTTSDQ
jgi:hypothetical protein